MRFGERSSPRQYRLESQAIADCTALSFSLVAPDCFLAGYSSGAIALFRLGKQWLVVLAVGLAIS